MKSNFKLPSRRGFIRTWLLLCFETCTFSLESTALAHSRHLHSRIKIQAQDIIQSHPITSQPLFLVSGLALLSLLPFIIIMFTSFTKISVVLSIVRSAIGIQQIPPTPVITGLSLILTIYIMAPVGTAMYHRAHPFIEKALETNDSKKIIVQVLEAFQHAQEPLRSFLKQHIHKREQAMFYSMAKRLRNAENRSSIDPDDFFIIVPSFVISELKEAFQIGFILFVPFLVVDMTVANILMALGMQMLSPTTISLPFKLLLFVMIDGWFLVTKGLVTGYI
ncbi:MAG: type III secretion system export apparatus subunit SctR [Myxococcales bacterium]|nr:type III secretion system export apparatus subunit SctR [Myxococcales bacterium]